MKVIIKRSFDGRDAEADVNDIQDPHWDCISGGVKKIQNGYSIYGYIPYHMAYKLGLASGQHDYYGNNAKIMVPASRNSKPPYQEGYQLLCDQAGEKPHFSYHYEGQLPCTKRILQLLETGEMQRKEIRQILLNERHPKGRIARAIKCLANTGRIECQGTNNNPKQILRKKRTDDKDTPIDIDDKAIALPREVSKI